MAKVLIFSVFIAALTANCGNNGTSNAAQTQVQSEQTKEQSEANNAPQDPTELRPAAWETADYLPQLSGKRIALLVNQTSTIGDTHLVDSLQSMGLKLVKIFAPEHGFRGAADAGASIKDGVDQQSGLPIKSLYGKNKKPSAQDLADIDVILFDIQDVGARFYTYISTLFYVMEANR